MKALNIIKCDSSCTQETLLYNPYKFKKLPNPTSCYILFVKERMKESQQQRSFQFIQIHGTFNTFKRQPQYRIAKNK